MPDVRPPTDPVPDAREGRSASPAGDAEALDGRALADRPESDASGFPDHAATMGDGDAARASGTRVITFGTFDLFHIGHLNILRRARALGDWLIVGVSSDELNERKKGRTPVFPLDDRLAIVSGTRYVDEVFVEESLELKGEYIERHRADVLVMGDDWQGRFDHFSSRCRVVYLPRTPEVSSSGIVSFLREAS